MKDAFRKTGALLLTLLLVSAVCLLFSLRKSGMFIDEIYTYGLSNSRFAPYLTDVQGGSMVDKVMTRQQLLDYVSVGDDDAFAFASVYYNQSRDVHPPLYYWLFNLASSLTPHVFSKWTGLVLDYGIYLAALALLYALVRVLGGSRFCAAAAAGLYGLSAMGLSTMLMIRMYVLMTALTLLLALEIALLMIKGGGARRYLAVGLTVFLGLMTQYYFVFYAFFLCAAYLLWALRHKAYGTMLPFCLAGFGGVGLLPLVFPACLDQLFADALVSGGSALDNLKAVGQYKTRLLYFIREMGHGLKAAILAGLVLLLLTLLLYRRIKTAKRESLVFLWILLPALPTLVLVALISPVLDSRYVYNLAPILVLAPALLFSLAERALPERAAPAGLLLALALALVVARGAPPLYLYPEYRDYDALLAEYADEPCVYMTEDYFAPVTEDLLQLLSFETFFVTGDPDSPALDAYLAAAGGERCVVYIDTSVFWSSGFDPEQLLPALLASTPYRQARPLYANGLSQTFILTK